MRQTVVGAFDSYTQACAAQQALVDGGFAQADISVYAMSIGEPSVGGGPRVYAAGGADVKPSHRTPVFDQLEQLFARLFEPGSYPPETEAYREVIRRGGAIVSADVSEVQADLACDIMRRTGATDIGERAKAWRTGTSEQAQEEPIRGSIGVQERSQTLSPGQSAPQGSGRSDDLPAMEQASMRTREGAPSVAPAAAPAPAPVPAGEAARARPDVRTSTPSASESPQNSMSTARTQRTAETGHIGDPIVGTPLDDDASHGDEADRRSDTRAENSASDDAYQRAYRHGATFREDERFRESQWQDVEPSAREQWESRYPESGWERFKAAVRHGWERVTEKR